MERDRYLILDAGWRILDAGFQNFKKNNIKLCDLCGEK